MEEIKIDDKAVERLKRKIIIQENMNLKTRQMSDQQMVSWIKKKIEEEEEMTRTMKIEGMMCPHCEARVKKCLEALPEVEMAEVSHTSGTAVVTLHAEVADDVLKKAVEAQDYPVVSIE